MQAVLFSLEILSSAAVGVFLIAFRPRGLLSSATGWQAAVAAVAVTF